MDDHDHDHDHDHFPHHICMVEGTGYDRSAESLDHEYLKGQNIRHLQELQRLRNENLRLQTLLTANNIPWKPEDTTSKARNGARAGKTQQSPTSSRTLRLRIAGAVVKELPKALPTLPREVQFIIMGHALKSSTPIIDPFFKLCKDNVTQNERKASGRGITIGFLGTCKALKEEGIRLIVKNNEFIFTQVAALQNFAKIPLDSRLTITNIKLRIVGRYYDQVAGEKILDGSYHNDVTQLKVKVHPRPHDMAKHPYLEAYCWTQVADFMRALRVPCQISGSVVSYRLLPSLLSMRVDLVNWCRHIPEPRLPFLNVMRTELGPIADKLMVTGCDTFDRGEEFSADGMLQNLIRDNGLYIDGGAEFISTKSGLKKLQGYGRNFTLRNASPASTAVAHPEGGYPPKSKYPPGRTVWRWLSDHYGKPKEWIEFHRKTGHTMELYKILVHHGEIKYEDLDIDDLTDDEDE